VKNYQITNVIVFPTDLDYDLPFSNIVTFAHLPWERCFNLKHDSAFDIAVVGFPFDTTVSVKPGARYGPRGIRSGSTKEKPGRTYNVNYGLDWHQNWARIIDCGDVPVTPYDNARKFESHMCMESKQEVVRRMGEMGEDRHLRPPSLTHRTRRI
jgi:arginase family enzyme